MKADPIYIIPYPNIIPVRGFSRSLLMDLYLGRFLFIPNYFCDFLLEHQAQDPQKEDYLGLGASEADRQEIAGLLDHLIAEDYLVEADAALREGLRTGIPVRTEDSLISDCIVELSALSGWDPGAFLAALNPLGVKFLEVRFLDFDSFLTHRQLIQDVLRDHVLEYVHLLVPFDIRLEAIVTHELPAFARLGQLSIYKASERFATQELPFRIDFSAQPAIDHSCCGCIDPAFFTNNVTSYYSNRKKNSCLAHKLSVDQFGEIRNCPSKKESFGTVTGADLERTVRLEAFKKEWQLTKESILVCSDCEFRWMCSDCRVFIQDESNPLSKPSKCGYNPYINKWSNEPGYLPEADCGVSIQTNRVVIDRLRLDEVNETLWR